MATISGGGYGSSISASIPSSQQTPQSAADLLIALAAEQLGQQQYTWAEQEYIKTSAISDQAINDFLSTSQIGLEAAQSMLGQFENVTLPEMNQLAMEAGQYSSDARVSQNMGQAESDASQTADAARLNAIQNLESFGVDPSSGMYADLERTANTQAGAAEAGAGQQAALNTANTGRQLLEQSILQGQQLPGDVVNSLNSAYQGIAGAANTAATNLNVGTAARGSAAPFLSAAASLKLPPVANTTLAQSNRSPASGGGGSTKTPDSMQQIWNEPAGNANSGGRYSGGVLPYGGTTTPASVSRAASQPTSRQSTSSGGSLAPGAPPSPGGTSAGQVQTQPLYETGSGLNEFYNENPGGAGAPPSAGGVNDNAFNAQNPNNVSYADSALQPFQSATDTSLAGQPGSFADGQLPPGFGGGGANLNFGQSSGFNNPGQFSNGSFNPGNSAFSQDSGNPFDSGGFNQTFENSGNPFDSGGGFTDWGSGDAGFGQPNAGNPVGDVLNPSTNWGADWGGGDQSSGKSGNDWTPPDYTPNTWGGDYSGGGKSSGGYGGGGGGGKGGYEALPGDWGAGYARGGPVRKGVLPQPTTGGRVPMRASPSMGQRTDDVKANLNAGEFVIPRDVVQMKGHEFFHKLITQARKNRIMHGQQGPGPSAPIGGQPSRQLPGPARFNSMQMGR